MIVAPASPPPSILLSVVSRHSLTRIETQWLARRSTEQNLPLRDASTASTPGVATDSRARRCFSILCLASPGSPPAAVPPLAPAAYSTDTPRAPQSPHTADPPWLRLMSAEALSAPPVQIRQLDARPLNVPLIAPFTIASATLSAVPNTAIRAVLRMCRTDRGNEIPEPRIAANPASEPEGGETQAEQVEAGIATGVVVAEGWGEAPVLPSVTEEDQATVLAACARAREWLAAQPPMKWHELLLLLEREVLPGHGLASVRAGVEMAILDALAVALALPLWRLFSPTCHPLTTDITIPICFPAEAASLTRSYRSLGFSSIKIKLGALPAAHSTIQLAEEHPAAESAVEAHSLEGLRVEDRVRTVTRAEGRGREKTEGGELGEGAGWGGGEVEGWDWELVQEGVGWGGGEMEGWEWELVQEDVARVVAVKGEHPDCPLLLDANGGYHTAAAVLQLLSRLKAHGVVPNVLEQPFHRSNWHAMRCLTAALSIDPLVAMGTSFPAAASKGAARLATSSFISAPISTAVPTSAPAPSSFAVLQHTPIHTLPSAPLPPAAAETAAAAAAVVVVADESCRGEGDVERIVREGAAGGVNVKLAKTGVLGALRVIAAVLAANRAASGAASGAAAGFPGHSHACTFPCFGPLESASHEARWWGVQEAGARGKGDDEAGKTGAVGGRLAGARRGEGERHGERGGGHWGGLQLMIGGMVETRIAMGFAAHMAAGLGCFQWIDLDTPLLLAEDPVVGGYTMHQDRMVFPPGCGHGGSLDWSPGAPLPAELEQHTEQ